MMLQHKYTHTYYIHTSSFSCLHKIIGQHFTKYVLKNYNHVSFQAALMILLTAQRQSAAGESSLLSQPEVVNVLQSLVNSAEAANDPGVRNTNPYSELLQIPSLGMALGVTPDTVPVPHSKSPPPVIANNMNLLNNTQSLTQLLGVISSQPSSTGDKPAPVPAPAKESSIPDMVTSVRPALMSMPPPQTTNQLQQQLIQQHQQQQAQLQQQQQILQQHQQQQLLQAQLAAVGQLQTVVSQPPLQFAAPPLYSMTPSPLLMSQGILMDPTGMSALMPPPLMLPPVQGAHYLMPQQQQNAFDIRLPALTSPPSISPVSRLTTSSSVTPSTPSPVSLKRKASIPPSPEDSPKGPYIGQHSQGLGGHYADSYWERKRFKQGF